MHPVYLIGSFYSSLDGGYQYVVQGREPCDPCHFYCEAAGGIFHRQFVKCIPECVALHCNVYVAVGKLD